MQQQGGGQETRAWERKPITGGSAARQETCRLWLETPRTPRRQRHDVWEQHECHMGKCRGGPCVAHGSSEKERWLSEREKLPQADLLSGPLMSPNLLLHLQ